MGQWVETFAATPVDLILIRGTHLVEIESQLYKVAL